MPLKIFAGDQDNVTVDNITYLENVLNISDANELLDSIKFKTFQDTLQNQSFAHQLILSQILYSNRMSPDSIVPASHFSYMDNDF